MISPRIYVALIVIFGKTISTHGQNNERLKVVVGFENIQRFYADVRKYEREQIAHYSLMSMLVCRTRVNDDSRNPTPENLNPDVKERICAHIFRSGVFSKMGLKRPHLPNHQSMFTNMFGGFKHGWITFTLHTPYKEFPEVAFPCSVTDRVTKRPRTYYISRAYDVNVGFDTTSVGRFILSRDENQVMSVLDVAEEAADLIEDSPAKLTPLYVESRTKDIDIAKNVKENNLCQLDTNQRHQVCSSVVNAQYFEDIVDYYMPEESEEKSCKDISEDSWMLEASDDLEEDFPVEEPLIVCAAKLFGGERKLYLVARGNEANNVFVFVHKSEQKISLLTLSSHIRNVFKWKLRVAVKPTDREESGTTSDSPAANEQPTTISEVEDTPTQ